MKLEVFSCDLCGALIDSDIITLYPGQVLEVKVVLPMLERLPHTIIVDLDISPDTITDVHLHSDCIFQAMLVAQEKTDEQTTIKRPTEA